MDLFKSLFETVLGRNQNGSANFLTGNGLKYVRI